MTQRSIRWFVAVALLGHAALGCAQTPVTSPESHDQHTTNAHAPQMSGMTGPLGVPMTRDGSGTSWLPDTTPMRAWHWTVGGWNVMLHGNGFLQYVDESSARGDDQFGSINWVMAMARRRVGRGELMLRSMLSAERLTVGRCGYPGLLATGESCNGQRLHDRQHPHDLFMELAADYKVEIGDGVGFEAYGGPAGEPALGPVAYPHRPSAMPNPFAPIGHHWLDATHISFGVVTGALYGRHWKAELSAFNGREPDEERYGVDLAPLDSMSGRVSILPSSRWALQVSAGRLTEAEEEQFGGPLTDVTRATASVTYHRPRGDDVWANTVAVGMNRDDDSTTHALLAESAWPLASRDTVFGRFEVAEKTAVDLALPIADPTSIFRVAKVSAGYARDLWRAGGLAVGAGASASLAFVPSTLEPIYDGRRLPGAAVFISVRPTAMPMNSAAGAATSHIH